MSGAGDKPQYAVKFRNEELLLYPEEVLTLKLARMKQNAEIQLGKPIQHAVITDPSYFNDLQKQIFKQVGVNARLDITRIINEQAAVGYAFGLEKDLKPKIIFIYSLGGESFDASLLLTEDGIFEVKAVTGNPNLGGQDFDKKLVEFFSADFQRKTGFDLRNN